MKTIDVWSDIACPWCFVGKRRLEAAIERRGEPVRVNFRAYMLQPDLPAEGADAQRFYAAKFGGHDTMREVFARMTEVGAGDGIAFDFAAMRRAPNTTFAHRLVKAAPIGQQLDLVEALFSAHFEHGVHVGSPEEVLAFLTVRGIDEADALVDRVQHGDDGLEAVVRDLQLASQLGVSGVPFFLTGRSAIPGAVPVEAFEQLLERAESPIIPA